MRKDRGRGNEQLGAKVLAANNLAETFRFGYLFLKCPKSKQQIIKSGDIARGNIA